MDEGDGDVVWGRNGLDGWKGIRCGVRDEGVKERRDGRRRMKSVMPPHSVMKRRRKRVREGQRRRRILCIVSVEASAHRTVLFHTMHRITH